MSRTDKDTPFWVKRNNPANWVGEDHSCMRWGLRCDIDEPRSAADQYGRCTHTLRGEAAMNSWYDHVGRAERHTYYWAPERAHAAAALNGLVKQYRAGSAVDAPIEVTNQHHKGPYVGGYWN